MVQPIVKPVRWVGSAREDLRAFPEEARRHVGQALYAAQRREIYPGVKPLRGFGGASVLEIGVSHRGGAYRAVYTVRFADAIYVLHVFEKKSKKGIETPRRDMLLIQSRLADAARDHRERQIQP